MCDSQDAVFARLTATFGRGFDSCVAHQSLKLEISTVSSFFLCKNLPTWTFFGHTSKSSPKPKHLINLNKKEIRLWWCQKMARSVHGIY